MVFLLVWITSCCVFLVSLTLLYVAWGWGSGPTQAVTVTK